MKKFLILVGMACLFQAHMQVSGATVGYWKFEENTGQTIENQEIAITDLTLTRGVNADTSWGDPDWSLYGRYGNCFHYTNQQLANEGKRDFLLGNSNLGVDVSPLQLLSFTIEAWIKLDSIPGDFDEDNPYYIVMLGDDGSNVETNYWLRIQRDSNGKAMFNAGYEYQIGGSYGGNHNYTHTTSLEVGQWYHIAFGHDATETVDNTVLWVNGVAQFYTSLNDPFTGQTDAQFVVGAQFRDDPDYRRRSFDGYIDELRISDNLLKTEDLLCGQQSVEGTLGYWNFEESVGQMTANEKGSPLSLTLIKGLSTDTKRGDPVWSSDGKIGNCLHFVNLQGSNEGARAFLLPNAGADISSLQLSNFTIEAWVKLDSIPVGFDENNPYYIIMLGDNGCYYSTNYWLRLKYYDSNHASFNAGFEYGGTGGNHNYTHSTELVVDRWYHVAFAHDSTKSTNNTILWVDGVAEIFNSTYPPYTGQSDPQFVVGAQFVEGTTDYRRRSFDGYIDELRISGSMLKTEDLLWSECSGYGTVAFAADFNRDCYVDLNDFAVLAKNWFECTDPNEN